MDESSANTSHVDRRGMFGRQTELLGNVMRRTGIDADVRGLWTLRWRGTRKQQSDSARFGSLRRDRLRLMAPRFVVRRAPQARDLAEAQGRRLDETHALQSTQCSRQNMQALVPVAVSGFP